MKYLLAFENEMADFVHKVKFDKVKSNFQRQLNKEFKQ